MGHSLLVGYLEMIFKGKKIKQREKKGKKNHHKIWFKDTRMKFNYFTSGQSILTSVLFKAMKMHFVFCFAWLRLLELFGISDSGQP